MPRSNGPSSILTALNVINKGANKYFVSTKGSSVYHADKYCHLIEDSVVKKVESHDVWSNADTCNYCTTEDTEINNIVIKTKYR